MNDWQTLPAWSSRKDIESIINDFDSVVIIGETGCGKSTIVPQVNIYSTNNF